MQSAGVTSPLSPGFTHPKLLGRPNLSPLKLMFMSTFAAHCTGAGRAPSSSVIASGVRMKLSSSTRSSMVLPKLPAANQASRRLSRFTFCLGICWLLSWVCWGPHLGLLLCWRLTGAHVACLAALRSLFRCAFYIRCTPSSASRSPVGAKWKRCTSKMSSWVLPLPHNVVDSPSVLIQGLMAHMTHMTGTT